MYEAGVCTTDLLVYCNVDGFADSVLCKKLCHSDINAVGFGIMVLVHMCGVNEWHRWRL